MLGIELPRPFLRMPYAESMAKYGNDKPDLRFDMPHVVLTDLVRQHQGGGVAELRVSRAAFYRWRRRGTGPAEVRLPGGGVRIRRSALGAWLRRLEQPQQEDTPE